MKGLADNPGIVLRHLGRKQTGIRQVAVCQISDLSEHLINGQDERRAEMLIILCHIVGILEYPSDVGDARRKEMFGLVLAEKNDRRCGDLSTDANLRFIQKSEIVPLVHFGSQGGGFLLVLLTSKG